MIVLIIISQNRFGSTFKKIGAVFFVLQELHAHLNGSLSLLTIRKLIDLKSSHDCEDVHNLESIITKLCDEKHNKTLDE